MIARSLRAGLGLPLVWMALGASSAHAQEPFDWIVPPNAHVILSTVSDTITGGNGAITTTKPVINGFIDVRDVIIPETSKVVFLGPNPVKILASGSVTIDGEFDLDGGSGISLGAPGVLYPGGKGRAGGGDGAAGSPGFSMSARGGGRGWGAFGLPGGGGQGGESGYHPSSKNARRGAGGGGGRFGPDVLYPQVDPGGISRNVQCQTLIGMDAEPGFQGGPDGSSAVDPGRPARGGRMGPRPFQDDSDANDFYGVARTLEGLVVGELQGPWAGSGGGAGGDAIRSGSFPNPDFPSNEQFGGPGGGGGGSLTILALGEIVVGPEGEIHADGGNGGGGENTSFLDHVGGAGGGGSGGHIILQSAIRIRVLNVAENAGPSYEDPSIVGMPELEHPARPIRAIGGQGGAGKDNQGGARDTGSTLWRCDAIALARLTVFGLMIPPLGDSCFASLDQQGSVPGAGGDGGPGLIQLHVPNPSTDLIFADDDLTKIFAPRPVGWNDGRFDKHLLPLLGSVADMHRRQLARRAQPAPATLATPATPATLAE